MNIKDDITEVFDSITMGLYVSEDGQEFSPVRYENSPLREKHINELLQAVSKSLDTLVSGLPEKHKNLRKADYYERGQNVAIDATHQAIEKYKSEELK